MKKCITHPRIGEVKLEKKIGNRAIRISVHPKKGVNVTLPWYLSYSKAISFLNDKERWVLDMMKKQRVKIDILKESGKAISSPLTKKEIEQMRRQARSELVPRLHQLAIENGFTDKTGTQPMYNRVAIKNNVTNWGSCSGKNNINLNMRMLRIPKHLCDYVMLHELCHLKYHNHGKEFHSLLNTLCNGDEKSLHRELSEWRLI